MIGDTSITKMREDEINQLVKGLLRHSEPYRNRQQKAPTKPVARRVTQRDKELMDCFRNR